MAQLRVDACFIGCTLRAALHELAPAADLLERNGTVYVASPANMPVLVREYPIGDLLRYLMPQPPGQTAEEIRRLMIDVLRSDDWTDNGGRFDVKMFGDSLIVEQTPGGHESIAEFLRILRAGLSNHQELHPDLGPSSDYALLNRPIAQLRLRKTPLAQSLQRLQTAARCSMAVQWPTIEAMGITRQMPVTIDLSGRTLADALDMLGRECSLTYVLHNGIIEIGGEGVDKYAEVRSYDLKKIEETACHYPPAEGRGQIQGQKYGLHGDVPDNIIALLEGAIAPDTWRDNGGAVGTARVCGDHLIIAQSPNVHAQIAMLFAGIDAATKPATAPATSAPARPRPLDVKVPQLDLEESPLEHAIDLLREKTQVPIVVDWKALGGAAIFPDAPVTLRLVDVRLETALSIVLQLVSDGKAKLAYRADEKGTVYVSTFDGLSRDAVSRVYNIRDLIDATIRFRHWHGRFAANQREQIYQDAVDSIEKEIEDTVESDSWKDNGGSIGALREFGGLLIVTQSPEGHQKLAALLEKLRKELGP